MPDYRHADELAALLSPRVRAAVERLLGSGPGLDGDTRTSDSGDDPRILRRRPTGRADGTRGQGARQTEPPARSGSAT